MTSDSQVCSEVGTCNKGQWKKDEHEKFLEGLKEYGKDELKLVADYIGTRTYKQTKLHAVTYFKRLEANHQDESSVEKKKIKKYPVSHPKTSSTLKIRKKAPLAIKPSATKLQPCILNPSVTTTNSIHINESRQVDLDDESIDCLLDFMAKYSAHNCEPNLGKLKDTPLDPASEVCQDFPVNWYADSIVLQSTDPLGAPYPGIALQHWTEYEKSNFIWEVCQSSPCSFPI